MTVSPINTINTATSTLPPMKVAPGGGPAAQQAVLAGGPQMGDVVASIQSLTDQLSQLMTSLQQAKQGTNSVSAGGPAQKSPIQQTPTQTPTQMPVGSNAHGSGCCCCCCCEKPAAPRKKIAPPVKEAPAPRKKIVILKPKDQDVEPQREFTARDGLIGLFGKLVGSDQDFEQNSTPMDGGRSDYGEVAGQRFRSTAGSTPLSVLELPNGMEVTEKDMENTAMQF